MRLSKPPALATWLVEHAIPGDKNEALAGDLLEQFGQGRSAAWYWRQVLAAILVGFSQELRILLVVASFTLFWISVLAISRQWLIYLSRSRPFQIVFDRELTLSWPASLIAPITLMITLNAVPLVISLATDLLIRRSFELRRFLRGLFVGSVAGVLGYVGEFCLPMHAATRAFTGYSVPLLFALLFSLWTARPNTIGRSSAKA